MAIQFHCPGCSQPIEVDDAYAGQTAACPYCRRVVNVPTETTLERQAPPLARPTAAKEGADGLSRASADVRGGVRPTAQPTPGEPQLGAARSPRELAASRYGTYGLVCAALVLLLAGAVVVISVGFLIAEMPADMTSQPSPEQMAGMQTAAIKKVGTDDRVKALRVGMAFFAVVGLACGIASLTQHRGNWKGIVSVVLCGLFALCGCLDLLSILAGATVATAASVA